MNFQLAPGVALQPELLLTERERNRQWFQNRCKHQLFRNTDLGQRASSTANNVIFHILIGHNFVFKRTLTCGYFMIRF
jgi:hypothetical protein